MSSIKRIMAGALCWSSNLLLSFYLIYVTLTRYGWCFCFSQMIGFKYTFILTGSQNPCCSLFMDSTFGRELLLCVRTRLLNKYSRKMFSESLVELMVYRAKRISSGGDGPQQSVSAGLQSRSDDLVKNPGMRLMRLGQNRSVRPPPRLIWW